MLTPYRRYSPRSILPVCAVAAASTVLTAAPDAGAQLLRFSKTTTGGVVATGNTLGLSKQENANGPGTEDSIGTFLSLDPSSIDDNPMNPGNPWPASTTNNWMMNGSRAVLALPADAQILYAELVWGGSYAYAENVETNIDDPVIISVGTTSAQATPDSSTGVKIAETAFSGFQANYYLRSSDVTSFVQAHGAATYAVSGVPATQGQSINTVNGAGWTLVVAYSSESEPARNLSIFVGGSFVDEDSQQDYSVSGFCTPPFGPVEGNVVVSALEGDANLAGDELSIGTSALGPFAKLSGLNNPATNFFASQINGPDGLIDTQGTFGTANHDPTPPGMNVSGGRQGWDLTTVPATAAKNQLENGQTSAVLRTKTSGDSFVPVALAFSIDVNAPDFSDGSSIIADVTSAGMGDTFNVVVTLKNSGEVPADLSFVLPLDPNLSLLSYTTDGVSGDAGGALVTAADLMTGVDAGTLAPGFSRALVLNVRADGPPLNGNAFRFASRFDYSYVSCTGDAPIDDVWDMPELGVPWDAPDAGSAGAAGTGGQAGSAGAAAAAGAAGAAGSAGAGGMAGSAADGGTGAVFDAGSAGTGVAGSAGSGGSGTGAGATPGNRIAASGDDGGCACTTVGAPRSGRFLTLGLLALVGLSFARRRRS